MHAALILFFAGPLAWVASPNREGIIGSAILSGIGFTLLMLGIAFKRGWL
jgi:hypothetical protein